MGLKDLVGLVGLVGPVGLVYWVSLLDLVRMVGLRCQVWLILGIFLQFSDPKVFSNGIDSLR